MRAVKISIVLFLFWFGAVKAYSDVDALNEHDRLRKLHGVPPLKLSKSLSEKAAEHAKVLATKKVLILSDSKGEYSENVCFRLDDPEKCTQYWYDEIKDYDFSNPGLGFDTAQFTKVVWAASTEFGWGQAQATNGFYFAVARYKPSGNVGSFAENVPRPLDSMSASGRIAVSIKAMIISICLGLLKFIY